MPITVKKDDLPTGGFVRIDNKDQIVMMNVTDHGPVFIFLEEPVRNVFVPWKEIMEYAFSTPAEEFKPQSRKIKEPAKQ
jgi:hypothetical protein